jgi:hypothetical protein
VGVRSSRRLNEFRKTKIENLHDLVAANHDVFRFDVAMNDPCRMGGGKGGRELNRNIQNLIQRKLRRDMVPQRLAVDKFCDDEVVLLGGSDLVNGQDVRMIQAGGGVSLTLKSMPALIRTSCVGRDQLDGNRTAQHGLVGQVYLPHTSRAQE